MNKLNKTHGLLVLFIILILVLVINPTFIRNMYSSILGRVTLVFIVLFFAMNNMTLGLLVALLFIVFSNLVYANSYSKEGLDNMDTDTNETMDKEKVKEKVKAAPVAAPDPSVNIDLETIKNSIQAKPSSSLPTAAPGSSEDVAPATKESFQSMYGSF